MRGPFYMKHKRQYDAREIGNIGTDDLIYTPDVVVFKTDERTDPIKDPAQTFNDLSRNCSFSIGGMFYIKPGFNRFPHLQQQVRQ